VPVGSFAMFNLAGPLMRAFGWQGLWWFGAALALAAMVIYGLVVSAPAAAPVARAAPAGRVTLDVLLNPASWLLAPSWPA
jgi:hypothetical protein